MECMPLIPYVIDQASTSHDGLLLKSQCRPHGHIIILAAYAWQYAGPAAAARGLMTAEWRGMMRDRMAGALIVLCEAGVDWLTDDGVRLMPATCEEWRRAHEVFCRVLKEARLSYVVLPRSVRTTEERLAFVLRSWRYHAPEK